MIIMLSEARGHPASTAATHATAGWPQLRARDAPNTLRVLSAAAVYSTTHTMVIRAALQGAQDVGHDVADGSSNRGTVLQSGLQALESKWNKGSHWLHPLL